MSLLQEEREIILSNEFVDTFDFAEVEDFVKGASKDLFISHHFRKKEKMLVQPRGGFPTYEKQFALYEYFVKANVDVLPLTIDSNTRLNDYATAKKMLRLSEENEMDMLNGYPLVNHGYRTTRKPVQVAQAPVQRTPTLPRPRAYTSARPASRTPPTPVRPPTPVCPPVKPDPC